MEINNDDDDTKNNTSTKNHDVLNSSNVNSVEAVDNTLEIESIGIEKVDEVEDEENDDKQLICICNNR